MSFKHNTWSKPYKKMVPRNVRRDELLWRHYRRSSFMQHAGRANVFSVGSGGPTLVGGGG